MDFELGRADGLLICSDSERNQDLFYLTGLRAPDPFVFLWTAREKILLVSDLEIDRARQEATVDRVLAVSHYENELRDKGNKHPSPRKFSDEELIAIASSSDDATGCPEYVVESIHQLNALATYSHECGKEV